jgi:hypothetical protein
MTIAARVTRRFESGERLALVVELPLAPAVGMHLSLPEEPGRRVVVTVESITLDASARAWMPGVYPAAVYLETAVEPATAVEAAVKYGWRAV